MDERKQRGRGERVVWTERDLKVIPWIFEQYSVRYDQLAELLGRWPGKETQQAGRLGMTTVRKLARRWKKARVVEYAVAAGAAAPVVLGHAAGADG